MKLSLKSTNLQMTASIKTYIGDRIGSLSKFLKRYEETGEIKAEIEIARNTRHHQKGAVFYAEANLHLPKKIIRAEYSAADIRAAIDKVKDKLKIELIKYKERHS